MARGEPVLESRRGMSPLIATVLLMAFAVALGGMIMNWSLGVSVNGECDQIKVSVTQFCVDNGAVRLNMQSAPASVGLQSVQLVISTGQIEQTINVRNSDLPSGAPLALSIPYAVSEPARVDLIGVVGPSAEPYACSENPIERVDPIQPC